MLLKAHYSIVSLLGQCVILFFLIQSNGFSQGSRLDSSIVTFMTERNMPGFAACRKNYFIMGSYGRRPRYCYLSFV
jgi:hypothetical protein